MTTQFTTELDELRLTSKNQLKGSENYKDWLRSVTAKLINKDVFNIACGEDVYAAAGDAVTTASTIPPPRTSPSLRRNQSSRPSTIPAFFSYPRTIIDHSERLRTTTERP